MILRDDVSVWVDESRCKACDICVSYCPAGVLGMRVEPHAVLGKMIEVVHPEACIGCRDCEEHCPDFAIYVADKGYKFAKLTSYSKDRAAAVKQNKFYKLRSAV
ncbi:4Fe-4S binding protein [Campylobacter sp. faydin G-24]|uniref:4Fe-4S binding protein n=1 Tax=Campylobacter anatolicus TaxID=2829105 RepID=A0ABS5HK14_9BACT|nr:4Fe-4S binding protein [Campylobacter anatolicus]MBR8462888.1 4Fe-4S binding protein [Campylobacter anatolicus]MBR8463962.1 4Fe-4S binding protein [Campylobacter anatolicus]MBR8465909.1 4Fe-4S binding protein [Campylobacter anatolicus]